MITLRPCTNWVSFQLKTVNGAPLNSVTVLFIDEAGTASVLFGNASISADVYTASFPVSGPGKIRISVGNYPSLANGSIPMNTPLGALPGPESYLRIYSA